MTRGDKDAYTDKQKREAQHIEEGYEKRGVPKKTAEARAWATVNKNTGGGNKSGSGRGTPDTHESAKRGGERGGKAPSTRRACSSCRRRPARIRAGGILCAYATNTMRT